MEHENALPLSMQEAFCEKAFLRRLNHNQADMNRLFGSIDWQSLLAPLLPITERLTCARALEVFLPLLDKIALVPSEGWLKYAYQTAVSILYPQEDLGHAPAQRDGAICFLQFLRTLFDGERAVLPFDPWLDFAFCTKEELKICSLAEEYRQFLRRFREEYVYELLRLGREVTPFRTLEHIAGVHHVSMMVSRAFKAGGGLVDLALMSGAAAGHDIGKFGCKPGERVPYLHYFYTDQWFSAHGLRNLGRIAANHSVWDLEIENLSAESLVLVYADFRVKQSRGEDGQEIARLFSLREAFDVILDKLDNVDDAKRRRYQYVYAKLQDFEDYLTTFGVDITLETAGSPAPPRKDAALMTENEVVCGLRRTAVDHNIRLMHRLSRERLFVATLEAARGEKDPARIRAYVSIFEEYFTYLSTAQKEQTLEFLYELLLQADGDVRRQAAALIGRILAGFHSGYKKELPAGTAPSPQEDRPFVLWAEYWEKLIQPDRRLTARQISVIRYQAKNVADALLDACSENALRRFAEPIFRRYADPAAVDADAAFALMDAMLNVPLERFPDGGWEMPARFAAWWLERGEAPQKAAAMRLIRRLLPYLPEGAPERALLAEAVEKADCSSSTPLLFLQAKLGEALGLDTSAHYVLLDQAGAASGVFLDNLKTATHWVLKAVGVEYLLDQAGRRDPAISLHIATHFSNLLKVSENIVVRRLAGVALLKIAPMLTPDRRNEVAVELSEALETGQAELSQYIPKYLGQFVLWLSPRELDEIVDSMLQFLSSSSTSVAAAALSTVGAMLEHYAVYAERFGEPPEVLEARRQRMAGLLLKGLASCMEPVRQEALHVLGEVLFGSGVLSYEERTDLFTLLAKKILFLITEQPEEELTFFYNAAALSHIYRFIVQHRIETGPFQFKSLSKAAFFPGTFDPFSLSHKGIVQAIRDLGMEVYLAIDEFSWSKKAQPSLIRRQIVSMSVADEFDVYLFPHDMPVNLATPDDLLRLRRVFEGRELYLAVGSDVVENASAYQASPQEGSVHSLNHILFCRASSKPPQDGEAALSRIQGEVIHLKLPAHLEDISSTRIRENVDLGRDIANLVDPTVQDYIYRNSLYLREPQYKQLVRASLLEFSQADTLSRGLHEELDASIENLPPLDERDTFFILRVTKPQPRILGVLTARVLNSSGLYAAFGSEALADYVRTHTAGRILLLTGLYSVKAPGVNYNVRQLLLTEALFQALADDCGYAVWWGGRDDDQAIALLQRQGFVRAAIDSPQPLLLVDMRSPVVLLQNIPTTLKEPFSSDRQVLSAIGRARLRLQEAICGLYPNTLVLSINAEVIYHRMVRMLTEENGVPAEPQTPKVLGPKMCVPFGKILRGNAVPNTVTKTIHTDKEYDSYLKTFSITPYPGYAPLESQIRGIRSFRRPVMLVDELLHSGNRIKALAPLFRKAGLEIDHLLVGLLSGRGRDLMDANGMRVRSVYFVPDLQAWFTESTLYPFIGGDAVARGKASVPGLTPAINMIMPYAFPQFCQGCGRQAVYAFSRVCIENSRDILLALERSYRGRYSRNLTLSRLSEAVILPLSPDKGMALQYNPNLSASLCLDSDLQLLRRMQEPSEPLPTNHIFF